MKLKWGNKDMKTSDFGLRQPKSRENEISFFFGLLCFSVVYIHTGFVENGFDIYSPFLESLFLRRVSSLVFMMVVPSFFITWGYLSHKYLGSREKSLVFIQRKLLKFFPLYLIFFLVNFWLKWSDLHVLPVYKLLAGALGLYYEPVFTGGHIYMTVLFCVIFMGLFKYIRHPKTQKIMVLGFLCILLVLLKGTEREQVVCYYRYLGYFTAYWLGVCLKFHDLMEPKLKSFSLLAVRYGLIGVGLCALAGEIWDWPFLEIAYSPNSPEQLFLTFGATFFGLSILRSVFPILHQGMRSFICHIGNNAYAHFIIHTFVIRLFIELGTLGQINPVVLQLFIFVSTSAVSVYLILPVLKPLLAFLSLKFVDKSFQDAS